MPSFMTFSSAFVATILLLGSVSAETSQGVFGRRTRGVKGVVSFVCYNDANQDSVNIADTTAACDFIGGIMYPNDPHTLNNCMLDNNYTDREIIASRIYGFCTSGYDQACSTQGDEKDTFCTAYGPSTPGRQ
ncbi:hypothetical protein TI39_contig4207g00001 [Zymoseptoria brevis]|uniref:Uncharacterized protein n=1 Tax=Zymoseptoria brevis TaxID=1047168 RepID=A0A0F4GA00_9PEZI|nr:hypothetical protein TI39_contig4207g00001 [Zymoseptoria brevis]